MKFLMFYMKWAIVVSSVYSFGQIGIGKQNPQATLDVNGVVTNPLIADGIIAPRITGEQLKSKDNIYTTSKDGAIVYVTEPLSLTSEKTKKILQKGYYNFDTSLGSNGEWKKMFFSPQVILGAGGNDMSSVSTITLSAMNKNTVKKLFITRSIEIKEKSLVMLNFSCPVSQVTDYNGGKLKDGTSKGFGMNLHINGNKLNNVHLARDGKSFSNKGEVYVSSGFQIKTNAYIVLEPGKYDIDIHPYVYAYDTTGISATFGEKEQTPIHFDIIAFPVD